MTASSLRDACSGLEVPFVPGTLRGYRWFNLTSESELGLGSARINSAGRCIPWRTHMTARCYAGMNVRWRARSGCSAPNDADDHDCGIYGWYTAAHISDVRNIEPIRAVIGAVEAHGRVLCGSTGFRAQHARIVAIACPPLTVSPYVYRREGIQVFDDPAAMFRQFPPHDVSRLVDDYEEPTEFEQIQAETRMIVAETGFFYRSQIAKDREKLEEARKQLAEVARRPELFRRERAMAEWWVDYYEDSIATWEYQLR